MDNTKNMSIKVQNKSAASSLMKKNIRKFLRNKLAVLGLIIPSLEYGGKYGIVMTVAGIFTGAICLNLIDKFQFLLRTVIILTAFKSKMLDNCMIHLLYILLIL